MAGAGWLFLNAGSFPKKPADVQKISAGFFYFGCGKNLPQNESKNLEFHSQILSLHGIIE